MKCRSTPQKYITFAFSCVFIFILTSQHADAARRSRVLPLALFASGMSLQFGSNFLKASAQNHYDTYLNAAIQADIQTHKDAFLVRRNASTIMSRVGLGFVGLAVLFSIYSQLDTPEFVEDSVSSAINWNTDIEIPLTRLRGFSNRLSENTSLLLPRTSFQLHPHYDFQTRRAGVSLRHFF
ncbi:hypothetical protein C6500_00875 [Candidatus Poribacteria bacterium]|nr:MAG: hypothetical protein C6500_00875 [Candidatus Poribacteria bacterium]